MSDDTPDQIAEAMNAALMARYWSEVPTHLRPPESDEQEQAPPAP